MPNARYQLEVFDCNIVFPLRFMIDTGIKGSGWMSLNSSRFRVRPAQYTETLYKVEIDVHYQDIISREPSSDPKWSAIPPLRFLSWDIECKGRRGHFPNAKKNPITKTPGDPSIMISGVLRRMGDPKNHFHRILFTWKPCGPIPDTIIILCKDEADMLNKWSQFQRDCVPNVFSGFNINRFDYVYMLDRSVELGLDTFTYQSRVIEPMSIKKKIFNSKGTGSQIRIEVTIRGSLVYDMYIVMRRDHKLSSYTLNYLSSRFLKSNKDDIHHSMISILWDLQGTPEQRATAIARLGSYCVKDGVLPLQLLEELNKMINDIEMARVTGVPVNMLMVRGQGVKTASLLARLAIKSGLVKPYTDDRRGDEAEQFQGATVIPPTAGFYTCPPGVVQNDKIITDEKLKNFKTRGPCPCERGATAPLGPPIASSTIVPMDTSPPESESKEHKSLSETKESKSLVIMEAKCSGSGSGSGNTHSHHPKSVLLKTPFIFQGLGGQNSKKKKKPPQRCQDCGSLDGNPVTDGSVVPVFDFASLYPSIMMALNLDYSTLLKPGDEKHFKDRPGDILKVHIPGQDKPDYYVKDHVQKGLLPMALKTLLAQRSIAKKDMAKCKLAGDKMGELIADGRQLALKISANSAYGYTGGFDLRCLNIGAAVTFIGRNLISMTALMLPIEFNRKNGYPCDSDPIYGDTDSVFNRLQTHSISVGMQMGVAAQEFLNGDKASYALHSGVGPESDKARSEFLDDFMNKVEILVKYEQAKTDGKKPPLPAFLASGQPWGSRKYPYPISIEFEKIFAQLLLIMKKRYAAMMYKVVNDPVKYPGKMYKTEGRDIKGLEAVRRDNATLLRTLMTEAIDILLTEFEDPLGKCIALIKKRVAEILSGKRDTSELIITKSIARTDYKGTAPAHVQLAAIMEGREKGTGPVAGGRIKYLLKRAAAKALMIDRIEEPIWALDHNIPLDYSLYVKKQLVRPMSRLMYFIVMAREKKTRTLFDVGMQVMAKPESDFFDEEHKELTRKPRLVLSNEDLKRLETKEKKALEKKMLLKCSFMFIPDKIHLSKPKMILSSDNASASLSSGGEGKSSDNETRTQTRVLLPVDNRSKAKSKAQPKAQAKKGKGKNSKKDNKNSAHQPIVPSFNMTMHSFVKRKGTCSSCKAELPTADQNICDQCKPNEVVIWEKHVKEFKTAKTISDDLWDKCRKCAGNHMSPDTKSSCANDDCKQFYSRVTAYKNYKDLEKVTKVFQANNSTFSLSW